MLIACAHCGKNVAEEAASCPYCLKNPKPPEASDDTAPKITYRLKLTPKGGSTEDTASKISSPSRDILKALTIGTDTEREAAIDYLLGEGQDMADSLADGLKDNMLKGRENIAKALGRMGSRSAVPALIEALTSSDLNLRLASAWALYRIGDLRSAEVFMELLKDKSPQMRNYVTHVVGGMGDPGAASRLVKMLEDPNPEVRGQAILSLTFLQGKKAIKIFQKARKDSDPRVVRLAEEAIRLASTHKEGSWKIAAIAAAFLVIAGITFWFLHARF